MGIKIVMERFSLKIKRWSPIIITVRFRNGLSVGIMRENITTFKDSLSF